jgi:NCAIR mutase (PurE)-related protein
MTFEEQIQQKVQETILKQIADCRYVDYHHSQKKGVPSDVVNKAWNAINWDEVVDYVRKEIQDKVCQTIVQNMLTEVKTDVKAILSVEGMRQKIRMEAYPSIKKAIGIED